MRRSQMIQRIYDVLNCDGVLEHSIPKEPVKLTEEHLLWIADEILKEVETSGMLPPEIDKIIEKHFCSVNEWEKE